MKIDCLEKYRSNIDSSFLTIFSFFLLLEKTCYIVSYILFI